uniref:Vegetative cell wall protein gp1-like n=1 Tax=Crassostrea virginica TaxID=6565 RepID=A0A8B8CWW5_CRAVI|nr:vegetative cell wall protein gp1-like [Crassostrea virginica]
MQEMESLTEPLSPTRPQSPLSPLSPSPPASPAPKRRKIPKSQKSGKPRATIIAIGSPPDEAHGVHPSVSSQEALATPTIKETPTTSRTPVTNINAQTLGMPSIPSQNFVQHPTPVHFRAC